jgi:hypothetical protein
LFNRPCSVDSWTGQKSTRGNRARSPRRLMTERRTFYRLRHRLTVDSMCRSYQCRYVLRRLRICW